MFYPSEFCCFLCNLKLGAIFVRCTICEQLHGRLNAPQNSNICLRCFSSGQELGQHCNDHDYKVVNLNDYPSFSGWTVKQELDLLDVIENSTFEIQLSNLSSIEASWPKISKVVDKSLTEFTSHIDEWLRLIFNQKAASVCNESIEKLISEFYLLRSTPKSSNTIKRTELSKELDNVSSAFMPLRPFEHTNQYRKMNGYRAARGDFETEMKDNFELKFIGNLDFNNQVAGKKLLGFIYFGPSLKIIKISVLFFIDCKIT